MELMRPALSVTKTGLQDEAEPGDLVDFVLTALNIGLYPSHITVTDTLPVGLNFLSFTSTVTSTVNVIGRDVIFDLQFGGNPRDYGIPRDEKAVITLTAQVDQAAPGGPLINQASVGGPGLELWPGDESDSFIINIINVFYNTFMPVLLNR